MQDDIIEAMSRAIMHYNRDAVPVVATPSPYELAMARAVLPIAMEHAAGIADGYECECAKYDACQCSWAADQIATAIRAAGQP